MNPEHHSPKYSSVTPRQLFEDIEQAIIMSYGSNDRFLKMQLEIHRSSTSIAREEKLRDIRSAYLLKPFILLIANGYYRYDLIA